MKENDERALKAPVSIDRDERSVAETDSPPAPQFDRPTADRYLDEIMRIRLSQERTELAVGEVKEGLVEVSEEIGGLKDFATKQALKVDNLEEIEPNGLRGKCVLVVEDDLELLGIINRLLTRLAIQVVTAASRLEAESLLLNEENRFDVALVDLRIPRTEQGFELARWICRMHPETSVIVMSGKLTAALDRLPVARLAKPFTFETLRTALYDSIGGASLPPTMRPPPMPLEPALRLELQQNPPRIDEDPVHTPEPVTKNETPSAKRSETPPPESH